MEKNWKDSIAELVKHHRGNESQVDVARRSGVSDKTISLIENSALKKLPRKMTVMRLALAFGADPKEWTKIIGKECTDQDIEQVQHLITIEKIKSFPNTPIVNGLTEAQLITAWLALPEESQDRVRRTINAYASPS